MLVLHIYPFQFSSNCSRCVHTIRYCCRFTCKTSFLVDHSALCSLNITFLGERKRERERERERERGRETEKERRRTRQVSYASRKEQETNKFHCFKQMCCKHVQIRARFICPFIRVVLSVKHAAIVKMQPNSNPPISFTAMAAKSCTKQAQNGQMGTKLTPVLLSDQCLCTLVQPATGLSPSFSCSKAVLSKLLGIFMTSLRNHQQASCQSVRYPAPLALSTPSWEGSDSADT